jgi:hypothetical protein
MRFQKINRASPGVEGLGVRDQRTPPLARPTLVEDESSTVDYSKRPSPGGEGFGDAGHKPGLSHQEKAAIVKESRNHGPLRLLRSFPAR